MSHTGKLLIAPPSVKGNFWSKTVIFVTEDHDRGSIGLVLNKPSKMSISEFSAQHNIESYMDRYIYIGGPVSVNALTMLHSSDWECSNTMHISQDFYLSSSPDLLQRLADGDTPNKWRLFAGLCAWAPNQLESEYKGVNGYSHACSWLVASSNYQNVFNEDPKEQWTSAIEQSGFEFAQKILV